MKKLLLILNLCLACFYVNGQTLAIKTKTFCWGDSNHNFHQQLTDDGKQLLDSLFKIVSVDTVTCKRLKMDDFVTHTSRKYLSEHKYEYVTLYKDNGEIKIRRYSNDVVSRIGTNKEVLLRYSKDDDNVVNKITIHIIE